MVRPSKFGFNPETAANNAFQDNSGDLSVEEIRSLAQKEFDELAAKLSVHGIEVIIYQDSDNPVKTDAVFPNNWISTHPNIIVTYPMFSENRRLERDPEIIKDLEERYAYGRRYYFEHYEAEGKFLEGTGSMILDRTNKILYGCLSERTNIEILEKFSVLMGYRKVYFHAFDDNNIAIYHTNVMMALAEEFCVVCLESIQDERERESLSNTLYESGKEIVNISLKQVGKFAGNMIQLKNKEGEKFMVMSEQAYRSLELKQIESIEKHCRILYSPLATIEKYGGGSARCMIAEIYK